MSSREPDVVFPSIDDIDEVCLWIEEGLKSYFDVKINKITFIHMGKEEVIKLLELIIKVNMYDERKEIATNALVEYALLKEDI